MNEQMEEALNEQVNNELYSAYLYVAMAAHFETQNLKGFANWVMVQAREELGHVAKFYRFVNDRGGSVKFEAIAGPPSHWESPRHVFEAILEHERTVTGCINDLVTKAVELRDHATQAFLQRFVNEQVEEEASVREILDQLRLVEGAPAVLFMLDRELAKRQPAPDPPPQGSATQP